MNEDVVASSVFLANVVSDGFTIGRRVYRKSVQQAQDNFLTFWIQFPPLGLGISGEAGR